MPMINCPKCGKLISDRMKECPECGYTVSNSQKYPQFYGNTENQVSSMPNDRQKFCKHCGQIIDKDCIICPKCGKQVEELKTNEPNIVINNTSNSNSNAVAYANSGGNNGISPKSRLITLLLCIFLGALGAHRFYTGKIITGIIMIPLMFVYIGEIWLVIDLIFIIIGAFRDKNGLRVVNW